MPASQSWVDPNTGATYPSSWVVWRDNQVDPINQIVDITTVRYASITCYSLGFQPLRTTGTQVTGAAYATWFSAPVTSSFLTYRLAVQGATGSYLAGAPEFSGAVFF